MPKYHIILEDSDEVRYSLDLICDSLDTLGGRVLRIDESIIAFGERIIEIRDISEEDVISK